MLFSGDKELMQLLVFDAKITEVSYKTSKWAAKDRREYVHKIKMTTVCVMRKVKQ